MVVTKDNLNRHRRPVLNSILLAALLTVAVLPTFAPNQPPGA